MIDTISHFLLSFWSAVLIHLWQTTLVVLPLFLLARGMRRAPARLTEVIWSLALVKLFLPLAVFSYPARELTWWLMDRMTPATLDATAPVLSIMTTVFEATPRVGWATVVSQPWFSAVLMTLTVLCELSILLFLFTAIRDLRFIGGKDKQSLAELPATQRSRLRSLLVRAGVPESQFCITDGATMPAVAGLLRPRIIVPWQLLDSLSDGELLAVLKHEETHRRRHDPLRVVVWRFCRSLFFFYPLLYPILKRLRESAEYACDEAALAAGIPPETYARALARTTQFALTAPPLAAAAGDSDRSLLRKRLHRLQVAERKIMSRYRIILLGAFLVVCAGSFLPLSIIADTPPPPPPKGKKAPDPAPAKAGESLVVQPELIYMEPPEYPKEALEAGVGGTIYVKALVSAEGNVLKAEIGQGIEGHPEFDKPTLLAAYQCKFKPGTRDGKPDKMWVKMPFEFRVDG